MNTKEILKFIQKHYQQNWSDADLKTIEKHIKESEPSCEKCKDKEEPGWEEPCFSCDHSHCNFTPKNEANILPE